MQLYQIATIATIATTLASLGAFAAETINEMREITTDTTYDGGFLVGSGSGATGKLTVSNGATFISTNGSAQVGYNGGTGEMTVTGTGTTVEQYSVEMRVGNGAGSVGKLTVSDGAVFHANMYPCVGEGTGFGSLTINNGTFGATRNSFGVGQGTSNSSITSLVTVAGSASYLFGNNLLVGRTANAKLVMEAGTAEAKNGTVTLGESAGGCGILEMKGGLVKSTGNMIVGNNGYGEVDYTGGTLCQGHSWSIGALAAGTGVFRMNGGTIDADNRPFVIYAGDNGKGTFEMNDGTVTMGGTTYVGNHDGSQGRFVMNGGTFTGQTVVGNEKGASGTFEMNGGTVTTGYFQMGANDGATGELIANGGTFECTDHFDLGNYGVGKLTINDGGLVKIRYWLRFCEHWTNSTQNACEVNLNKGGTLCVGKLHTDNTSDENFKGVFNWNGGTLTFQWYGADEVLAFAANERLTVNVTENGGILDTTGANRTIAHSLSGEGALTKRGAEILTLAGLVDLKGGFIVEEGTLKITSGKLVTTKTVEGETVDNVVALVDVAKGATLDLGGETLIAQRVHILGTVQNGTLKVADSLQTQDISGKELTVYTAQITDSVTISATGDTGTLNLVGDGLNATPFDKLTLSGNIKLVLSGVAITLPETVVPAKGLVFKDTEGDQLVYIASCANGLTFDGNANLKEPYRNWLNATPTFNATINSTNNVFTFDSDLGASAIGAFSKTPLSGAGELKLKATSNIHTRYAIFARSVSMGAFTGKMILENGPNFGDRDRANGQSEIYDTEPTKADDSSVNAGVVLYNDDTDTTLERKHHFVLRSGNGSTPPVYYLNTLETAGSHPELLTLASRHNGTTMTSTLYLGEKGGSGTFAGILTNECFSSSTVTVMQNWNIVKRGTGTWNLTGTVANGGAFTVEGGTVAFSNGVQNVSALSVKSGATAVLCGTIAATGVSLESGATLQLDAADAAPVVNADLDLTGVNLAIGYTGTEAAGTADREILRVASSKSLTNFKSATIKTDLPTKKMRFTTHTNADGSTSVWYTKRLGLCIIVR